MIVHMKIKKFDQEEMGIDLDEHIYTFAQITSIQTCTSSENYKKNCSVWSIMRRRKP